MLSEAMDHGPLGILGGTFDPIHIAHLRMAQEGLEACGLERVRFIPAGQPTHRQQPGVAAIHRLAMTRLAVRDVPQFDVDEAEVLSAAPSYTVPTLERLRQVYGTQRPLVLLLGADAFMGLTRWHRWSELFALAHIAVATRPGHRLPMTHMDTVRDTVDIHGELPDAALAEAFRERFTPLSQRLAASPGGQISLFPMTPLDISATAIRAQLAAGKTPRFLVPDGVLDYIQTHHLYV